MRVMVTGGLGVNGAWVLRSLVKAGLNPVSFDYSSDTSLVSDVVDKVDVVKGDITDGASLSGAIKEHAVDSVVHMAGLVSPEVTSLDPLRANPVKGFDINAKGTLNVFESARGGGVKRVVFTSSKAVYGEITGNHGYPNYEPITEDYEKRPLDLYGVMKLFCENMGQAYSRIYGIEFVSLRFAHIYSPGKLERHGPLALHDRMVNNAVKGIPTEIERGGDTKDDLIYVKDVAKAVVLALTASTLGHSAYHFGSGTAHSIREFVSVVKEFYPKAVIELGPGVGYYGEKVVGIQCALDYGRAKKDLGFEPEYDLRKGISHYIGWLNSKGDD